MLQAFIGPLKRWEFSVSRLHATRVPFIDLKLIFLTLRELLQPHGKFEMS